MNTGSIGLIDTFATSSEGYVLKNNINGLSDLCVYVKYLRYIVIMNLNGILVFVYLYLTFKI